MKKFQTLGLIDPILRVIEEHKFDEPTEIQEKAIPAVLANKDVIAGSATGSGKTLAFGAGIIQHATRGKGIQALVLTPTRELAEQVAKTIQMFSKYKPLNLAIVYGGVALPPQIHQLQRADVVIGTPGRILDHLARRTIDLSKVNKLVLDEADRMLDMGFVDDVEKIIKECPKERQTLLFSATISSEITQLSHKYMHHPVKISVECYVDPAKLTQVYYDVPDALKFSLLSHLVKHETTGLVMVFCNSRDITDLVAKNLKKQGIDAVAIHGGFSQGRRNQVMDTFHAQHVTVMVCTDVAARGLDIKGVSHVYNYDIPKDSKQYVHRVGRTARAGTEGKAINLLTQRDHESFGRVVRENRDMKITKLPLPQIERVQLVWPSRDGSSSHGRSSSGPRRFGERSQEHRRSGPTRYGQSRGDGSGSRPQRSSYSNRSRDR